jgi:hypothetical protein
MWHGKIRENQITRRTCMTDSTSGRIIRDSESVANAERRSFLKGAGTATVIGTAAMAAALASPAAAQQTGDLSLEQLRQDMMGGIEDDVKKDLQLRANAAEELPKPAGLREAGMLDARFPVYYETSVAVAMPLLTRYFAALSRRDMREVAQTLHFPYATYEGTEPIVYQSAQEFISNPPPSMNESAKPDSQLRPGTYDIMDNLQLQTFNPVNVGLELCYTRYRADGYKIGINQGIYAITNNDGKWGIQLSSIIFTPTEYIGQTYNDAVEAHLRQGRTGMAAFGERDYDLLTHLGWGAGSRESTHTRASIAGAPGATSFFLSAWSGKPMEPYNSKGRTSRLSVVGPNRNSNADLAVTSNKELTDLETEMGPSNIVTKSGKPGWFFEMAGGGVGHYAYTMDLNQSKVLHAGPEKAHAIGGYIRYTHDNIFISETRSLGIMIYDLRDGVWESSGGLGQSMRRDRTNDASPQVGSLT